jgi:hypothetical protein
MKMNKKLNTITAGFVLGLSAICFPSIAQAASCSFPSNQVVPAGGGKPILHQASGFAFATYFLDYNISGNLGLIGFNLEAQPGFRKDQRKGFFGPSTNLYTSFFVSPQASSGQTATVTEKVIDLTGRTICQGTFTITAQ